MIFLCAKLMSKGAILMNTYIERINAIRDKIDFEVNENEALCLTSPELVEKALMIEQELALAN